MNSTKVYLLDTAFLKNNVLFGELYHTVSTDRQRKIDSFRFDKDKRLCLGAELVLNKALSDVGINEYEVGYEPFGKPYVKNENIFFSLSHSEKMVMCAISDANVGCDIEKITDIDLDVAKRFFNTTEYDAIISAGREKQKQEEFFRYWTLKESFMKITGLGMKLSLSSFTVVINNDEITICQNVDKNKYFFKEYNLPNGYKCAVCSLKNQFDDAEYFSSIF